MGPIARVSVATSSNLVEEGTVHPVLLTEFAATDSRHDYGSMIDLTLIDDGQDNHSLLG